MAGSERRYILNGDGTEELYDFERDYWEQHDLASQAARQSDMARFRAELKRARPASTAKAGGVRP